MGYEHNDTTMKAILICALAAVAASQFASSPAEVILQRQGSRAILTVPESFNFGNTFQSQSGARGSFGGQSSFLSNQRRSQFQQQQEQQSQRFQQGQNQFQNQRRAPVQPSTILAGGSSQGAQLRAGQQQQQFSQQLQQQEFSQQQQQGFSQQQQRGFSQQQQQQEQRGIAAQQQRSEEVQGVFEPLNLPSGASLLLGQVSTEFSCNDLPYGYYADEANYCLVFHICYPALFSSGKVETYQYSFMCGEGTQFDQNKMVCVSRESALPCEQTKNYYFRNAEFGLPHEKSN